MKKMFLILTLVLSFMASSVGLAQKLLDRQVSAELHHGRQVSRSCRMSTPFEKVAEVGCLRIMQGGLWGYTKAVSMVLRSKAASQSPTEAWSDVDACIRLGPVEQEKYRSRYYVSLNEGSQEYPSERF